MRATVIWIKLFFLNLSPVVNVIRIQLELKLELTMKISK